MGKDDVQGKYSCHGKPIEASVGQIIRDKRKLGVTNRSLKWTLCRHRCLSSSFKTAVWAAILSEIGSKYGSVLFGSDVGGI